MPKLKTVKGVTGRFKITGRGRVVGYRAGRRHLLAGRTPKRKRHMRGRRVVSRADERKLKALMPYAA